MDKWISTLGVRNNWLYSLHLSPHSRPYGADGVIQPRERLTKKEKRSTKLICLLRQYQFIGWQRRRDPIHIKKKEATRSGWLKFPLHS